MTLTRSAPPKRHTRLKQRRTEPRRVVHPFPLPTPGEVITLADVETELHAFGPQADLCRRTECAACFAVRLWRNGFPRDRPLPWSLLITGSEVVSHAHHEPHRGLKGESLDRDTMPLCAAHHTDEVGNGDAVRHRHRSDKRDAASFYDHLPFRWQDVVAEMQRRSAANNPKPVVDTTAQEQKR